MLSPSKRPLPLRRVVDPPVRAASFTHAAEGKPKGLLSVAVVPKEALWYGRPAQRPCVTRHMTPPAPLPSAYWAEERLLQVRMARKRFGCDSHIATAVSHARREAVSAVSS